MQERNAMREILIAAIMLAAPAFAAEGSNAEGAIRAVVAKIDTCLASKDTKCLDELFADDATFGGPDDGGKLITGKAAILRSLGEMMKDPGTQDVKQVRTVDRVRLIGTNRALVDSSVTGVKEMEGDVRQAWHALMSLRLDGDKWLLEDVRSYVVVTGPPPTPLVCPTFVAPPTQEPAEAPKPTAAATQ